MKKFAPLFVFFISFNSLYSQLYVSPNTYVFNKDRVVFVKGDIELNAATSNFYLRNEGQLLQGTTGTSTNKGTGKLSVFQEGTSDEYAYNFWCSPVGNASAAVGNENFGITMLNQPTSSTVSTPVGTVDYTVTYDSTSSPLVIADYWIWKYLNSSIYALNAGGWIGVHSANTLVTGEGFTMKGTLGDDNTNVGEATVNNPVGAGGANDWQRYDFRGKPNDGTIPVGVALGQWTLTGNPYPSALHVNAFLLDGTNTACNGTAYYWEQDKNANTHAYYNYRGGYGTYSPVSLVSSGIYVPATYDSYFPDGTTNTTGASSGLSIERKYAPIGQGFMISGASTGTVNLKNTHRSYYKESTTAFSHFEKPSNGVVENDENAIIPVSLIRLIASVNDSFTRQIALGLIPEATDGFDRGIDAVSPTDTDMPNDVYFKFDGERYVIQGVSFDENKRLKLGIKVDGNTSFKFSILEKVLFDENQPIYIYDGLDNTYHEITDGSYTINLTTGIYDDRFELTFRDGSALGTVNNVKEDFIVIQNNENQLLTILNPKSLNLKSALVYDITGKKILDKKDLGSKTNYEFPTSALSEGVYLVKLKTTDNVELTNKIIVQRVK